jgi:hypothetical protein
MATVYISLSALKEWAGAKGFSAEYFDEVYHKFHIIGRRELSDASASVKEYVAGLLTSSWLFELTVR